MLNGQEIHKYQYCVYKQKRELETEKLLYIDNINAPRIRREMVKKIFVSGFCNKSLVPKKHTPHTHPHPHTPYNSHFPIAKMIKIAVMLQGLWGRIGTLIHC